MMMFSGTLLPRLSGFARALALCTTATLALVACGGGTSQQQTFQPTRVFAFGDEASLLTADGRKHAVNALKADDTLDCTANPLWVQAVATTYNFVFSECNPSNSLTVNAFMRAAAGAKVADLKTQVDAQVAAGGFTSKDLVLMMVGSNDVLELYKQYPTRSEADIISELRARGDRVAEQVNRVVGLGGKVIVSTIIDLSLSPYAKEQKAAFTDTDRAALIKRMVEALNGRLRVGIVNDGRFVGLVLADETVQVMVLAPASFSLNDAVTASCTSALPNCTSKTLIDAATATTHLWSDSTHLSAPGQSRLGLLAQQRALNNPFF
jgi:outer membrane lipase/esterase